VETVTRDKSRGLFICIEGIDGSGKTTAARRVVKALIEKGYDAVYTAEPSKGVYGNILKKSILQGTKRFPKALEAVLFTVDRLDHIEKEIRPQLEAGRIVVCDRYYYSSIAYQGTSKSMQKWVKEINKHAIKPDLAIYIDVPPEVMVDRIKRKKSVMETLETQKSVRKAYLKQVREGQLEIIEGNVPKNEVAQAIIRKVLGSLKKVKHAELFS
jgi:dTMP kinase